MTTNPFAGTADPSTPITKMPEFGEADKRRIGVAVVVAALAAGLTACGSSASASTPHPGCASSAPRITVEASGRASATPDILTIDIGVSVSDPTASTALSDANSKATTLTNALKLLGVASPDAQSTDFSISPTFAPNGAITGYQVSNTLLVTLRHLSNAGQVIDLAAASVGNAIRINGLTFAVSNTGNVDGRARAAAVITAAAHAHAMAAAAGESLGGICSVVDSTNGLIPVITGRTAFGGASNGANLPVPLEPGAQQASAQVTVVYAMAPRKGGR